MTGHDGEVPLPGSNGTIPTPLRFPAVLDGGVRHQVAVGSPSSAAGPSSIRFRSTRLYGFEGGPGHSSSFADIGSNPGTSVPSIGSSGRNDYYELGLKRVVGKAESAETKPESTETGDGESLYERLGGDYGIAGAVDDLVDRLYENDAVNQNPETLEFHEEGGQAGFKYLVTAWSIEATGGPEVYAGRDMEEAHEHLELSDHEFDVVYTAILQSLHQAGVPEQECDEFMDIIESYRDMVVYDRDYDEDPGYVESPATAE